MKNKRYVIEFANDILKCCTHEVELSVIKILNFYKKGLITDFEAVKMLTEKINA